MESRLLGIAGILALLAPAAPFPQGAHAEGPPARLSTFGERVDVEVVNIDVVVTDRDGTRVTDLGRDDFELRIDGRPVAIDYFAGPRLGGVVETHAEEESAGGPDSSPPEAGGTLLVFADFSALDPLSKQLFVGQVRDFLVNRSENGDPIVIAVYDDGFRVLETGGAGGVARALDQLAKLRTRGTRLLAEKSHLELQIRRLGQGGGDPSQLASEIKWFADQEVDRQRRMLAELERWLRSFAALDGRKSLLFASPGVSAAPAAYFNELATFQARATDPTLMRALMLDETQLGVYDDFERLLGVAQEARIAVYPLTPRELPQASTSAEFPGLGPNSTRPPPRDRTYAEEVASLTRLGEGTGGRRLAIDEVLARALDVVSDDAEASYSLGFTAGPAWGTKQHEIEVSPRRKGLTARHRESFRLRSRGERLEEALGTAAATGVADPRFPLTVACDVLSARSRSKKGRTLPVAVRIPLAAILPSAEEAETQGAGEARAVEALIEVRLAVRDAEGRVHLGESMEVPISVPPNEIDAARSGIWVHRSEIDVQPGKVRVAALVVDALSGDYATATADVDVPKR